MTDQTTTPRITFSAPRIESGGMVTSRVFTDGTPAYEITRNRSGLFGLFPIIVSDFWQNSIGRHLLSGTRDEVLAEMNARIARRSF